MALNYDSPLIDNTTGSPTLDSLKSGSDKINEALTEIKEEVNDLGSASLVDTGTAAGDVPLNSSLVPKSGGTFTGDIAAPKITASTGILFGTDTAAANTLDDYETGTWTPVADSGITGWGLLRSATYIKVGESVTATAYIDGVEGKDANQIQLSGLPFVSIGGDYYSVGACQIKELITTSESAHVRNLAGTDKVRLFKGSRENVTGNDITGSEYFIFTLSYQTV